MMCVCSEGSALFHIIFLKITLPVNNVSRIQTMTSNVDVTTFKNQDGGEVALDS